MILGECTHFLPHLCVNVACAIDPVFFNQWGCAVKTALEMVFCTVFLLEEPVLEDWK